MSEWQWVEYTNAAGKDVVAKEREKLRLGRDESVRLSQAMKRVRTGETRADDVDDLGDGLLEVRSRTGNKRIRVFYARIDDELVLLALRVIVKKAQRVPHDIEVARKRLRDWQSQGERAT